MAAIAVGKEMHDATAAAIPAPPTVVERRAAVGNRMFGVQVNGSPA